MVRYNKHTGKKLTQKNPQNHEGFIGFSKFDQNDYPLLKLSSPLNFIESKLVSIIVPTRERYDLAKKLLLSIEKNTKNHNAIELILIADSDDTKSATELLPTINELSFDTYIVFRQRPNVFSLPVYYYSLGLEISNNSYFKWILGNDCEIMSKDWDKTLENFLLEKDNKKRIVENEQYFYIRISDDTHLDKNGSQTHIAKSLRTESCCFPIVSSNYIKDFGEFYSMDIPTHAADMVLIDVMKSHNANIADLFNIEINHHSYWNDKYHKDEPHINMCRSTSNKISPNLCNYRRNKTNDNKITHYSKLKQKNRESQTMSQSTEIIKNLNAVIDKEIENLVEDNSITTYEKLDKRQQYYPQIIKIINSQIPQIPSCHNQEDEAKLKQDGYLIIPNFLSGDEVDNIKAYLDTKEGYNAHVPIYSDGKLRKFTSEYNFSTLSYDPGILLNHPLIIEKIQTPEIISLTQAYLGCFPTLFSLNSWWSKYRNEVYGTQKNHRDHDDFKFLAFFIYLSDINEKNGPHVFYPRTQNGESENSVQPVSITGKAGTAIIADTYAVHRGDPLQEGSRLVCWWRYGLSLNKMYYHNQENKYKILDNELVNKIKENIHNHYLFRGFL